MGVGFVIFMIFFSVVYCLQIVGFFSPNWQMLCVKGSDPNITNSGNETCGYQGLFYRCDDTWKCRLTKILDKRVFGLAVAIIVVNIFVVFLAIFVVIANDKDTKKGWKALAMLLFTLTEILNIASTIIVWIEGYTIGWSWWLSSWSAVGIIALTCLCCISAIAESDKNLNEEKKKSNNKKRYVIYVVDED